MPELPDVELYLEALAPRIVGEPLLAIRLRSPFLVRSVTPRPSEAEGRRVVGLRRLGKRIVWELEGGLFLVFHLMITGRFRWRDRPGGTKRGGRAGASLSPRERGRGTEGEGGDPIDRRGTEGEGGDRIKVPGKVGLAAFDFPGGTVLLTEAGSKKRASLHVVAGEATLAEHDPGGLEVLTASLEEFRRALTAESRTLKRALTDPRILSGIGNAFSDEILHAARLSPFKRTGDLTCEESERLYGATRSVLVGWIDRLRAETGDAFPEKVTAFRPGFAVHGRFGEPCPTCGGPVQRILYAENEANYCPACQTGGKLLADRVLSRLFKDDWPKTLEELERRKAGSP